MNSTKNNINTGKNETIITVAPNSKLGVLMDAMYKFKKDRVQETKKKYNL